MSQTLYVQFENEEGEMCWVDLTASPFYCDPEGAERRLEFYQSAYSDIVFYGVDTVRGEMVDAWSDFELYNRVVKADFAEASRLFPGIHAMRRVNKK